MERGSVESIIQGLNEAGVRYLVVGGLAVVAHGYLRFTADLDLLVDLEEQNLIRALRVFEELGYRPRAPVELADFARPENRAQWIQEKGLLVFSLWSEEHPATEVDLFSCEPEGLPSMLARSVALEIAPDLSAPVIGLEDLIRLKETAGRPRDREDIARLREIAGEGCDE